MRIMGMVIAMLVAMGGAEFNQVEKRAVPEEELLPGAEGAICHTVSGGSRPCKKKAKADQPKHPAPAQESAAAAAAARSSHVTLVCN